MKKLFSSRWVTLQVVVPILGLVACSQSTGSSQGAGGSSGSGGAAQSTGGAPSGTGGVAGSGGTSSTGGFAGLGGTQGSAGIPGTGGTAGAATGGNSAGSSGTGGSKGTGGTIAGGAPGAGGSSALGGSFALGGSAGTGSSVGTGGSAGTGGTGGAVRDAGPVGGNDTGPAGAGGAATGGTGGGGAVACPAGGTKPTEGKKTVMVGTTSRSYYLHVPSKYDGTKPAPLVVDFHGLGGNGTLEAGSNPYKSVIEPEGVLSAYPDGANGTNGTGWNLGDGLCCTTVDDVAFAKALVKDVQAMACIDPKRVYAVGFSLGGGMVHVLACKAADVFAAVSPAASDLVKETVDSCKPARPITVFTFRGTADPAVPYAGGSMGSFTNIGAKATFQKWADLDQCTGSPSAEDSNGCSTYASCAGGVQVTLCTKQGGVHEPGDASVSWPVLKKYTLP